MPVTARYAAVCSSCSGAIVPGESITRIGQRWGHVDCTGKAFVVAPGVDEPVAPDVPVLPVWTDGACSGNPGPGGWAWATADGRQGSGADPATTNQRMEIRAALEAVIALPGPLQVISDSTYVVNCFRDGWWKGWLARGWVNSAKKPVANRDLWEPLITLVRERDEISFCWVKGHSGDPMNDLVDQLAVAAARSLS